jgi:Xaa-Pro aminopeptidase
MVKLELRIERKDFSMISQHEYQARRQKLAAQLPENSIAVVAAAQEAHRNGDAHYRFRQDSDFYYLTGFNEPDALLIVISGTHSQSIFFNRMRNPAEEQWTGKRLGQEGAVTELQMNAAFPIHALKIELPK